MHKLTPHQTEIADEILDNLRTTKIALLSGISGVGKTTTTEYIVSKYKARNKKVWLTATTHKALEVLHKLTSSKVEGISTLHSFLNMIPDRSGPNKPMMVDHRKPLRYTNLLVIDEYSMMTKDVINALSDYIEENKSVKVLFVGDASQLILSNGDIDALKLDDKTSYLTEPMRQGKMSDIAIYSKMVSAFILGRGPEPIVPYGDEIIKYENHDDFIRAWKKSKTKEKAIIAFKNITVKSYNTNIVKHYRHQTVEYEPGNRVVLRSLVKTKSKLGNVELIPNRRTVTLKTVVEHDGFYDVDTDEGAFMIPKTATWLNQKLKPYADKGDWASYYREKEKYAMVHHADALTVYGSQGSSYYEVFIDASDMMTAREDVRRMAYVSISRAKQIAHVFIGEKRNYKRFAPEIDDIE